MKELLAAGVLALGVALSGCVGVSMHSLHRVEVTVQDAASSAPVADVSLAVLYDYDSYGWFYFFNEPDDEKAVTDRNGVAVMNLADFRYRILLKVADNTLVSLEKKIILEGGSVASPPYHVMFKPT